MTSIEAGCGDALIWATDGQKYGFRLVTFGKENSVDIVLGHSAGESFRTEIFVVPPKENEKLPPVTEEQRAENTRRMAQEDSIRNAYVSTFLTAEEGKAFAIKNGLDPDRTSVFLVDSKGNHAVIEAFLTEAKGKGMADKAQELSEKEEDLERFIRKVIEHGDFVLSQTPEMLPVLKQAGVVDSGGQGLMQILRGALDGFLGKEIPVDDIVQPKKTEEPVAMDRSQIETADIKFGYLNKKGEIVIPPIYSQAKSFSQGLASVKDDKSMTGYIDSKGNLKINYQYANGERFNKQGLAIVLAPESEYYGVIDKNGKYVINPQFEYMFADDNGYIIRLDKHGDYGYCDMQGKLIINPQFQHMHKFGNTSLAPVASGGAVGFVDKKGKMIIQPQFESASCFNGNYAVAGTAGKFGFIDESGKYIVNPQFQAIGEDFKYSKDEIKSTPYNSVESRYINIDKIADKIKKLLTNDKLDGMSFPPSVQEIQARYKIEDSEIPVYSDLKTSLGYWDNNVSANLLLNGYFYKEVSDGWWGTNRVIDKLAKADKIQLSINLFYLAFGRSDDLVLGLSKVLNKGYENYTFDIRSKGKNNVIINISRQK